MMRFLGPTIAIMYIGARVLFAFGALPFVLAHEAHFQPPASSDEAAFLKENDAAMIKMMNDMAAKPSGDIDRDFVAMMTPHHQGAIDMAQAQLRFGRNEQLRRIAQEIIVEQQQEIAAMRLAIGRPLAAATAAPQRAAP